MLDILDLDCKTYILIICNASSYFQTHVYVQVIQTTRYFRARSEVFGGQPEIFFDLLH